MVFLRKSERQRPVLVMRSALVLLTTIICLLDTLGGGGGEAVLMLVVEGYQVRFKMIQCDGLKDEDLIGKNDMKAQICFIYTGSSTTCHTTSTDRGTNSPRWNFERTYGITQLTSGRITIKLTDVDTIGSDDQFGTKTYSNYNLKGLRQNDAVTVSFSAPKPGGGTQGTCKFSLTAVDFGVPCTNAVDCNGHASSEPSGTRTGGCVCSCLRTTNQWYTGAKCDSCTSGYGPYSSGCYRLCTAEQDCNKRATSATGNIGTGCTCNCIRNSQNGWGGSLCTQCAAGYEQYPTCSRACTVTADCGNHATSATGNVETGCSCSCTQTATQAWTGSSCNTCAPGYEQFPNCYRTCTNTSDCNGRAGTTVTGNVNTGCKCNCMLTSSQGYAGPKCNQCATGYGTLPGCYRTCTVKADCNSHASSASGTVDPASGGCSCNCLRHGHSQAWTGASCDTCAAGYENYPSCYRACTNSADCSGRASKVSGNVGSGCQCTCPAHFSGPSCHVCAAGYVGYPNCYRTCTSELDCNSHAAAVTGNINSGCQCHCYHNYAGTSCGSCAKGYSRFHKGCHPNTNTKSLSALGDAFTVSRAPTNSAELVMTSTAEIKQVTHSPHGVYSKTLPDGADGLTVTRAEMETTRTHIPQHEDHHHRTASIQISKWTLPENPTTTRGEGGLVSKSQQQHKRSLTATQTLPKVSPTVSLSKELKPIPSHTLYHTLPVGSFGDRPTPKNAMKFGPAGRGVTGTFTMEQCVSICWLTNNRYVGLQQVNHPGHTQTNLSLCFCENWISDVNRYGDHSCGEIGNEQCDCPPYGGIQCNYVLEIVPGPAPPPDASSTGTPPSSSALASSNGYSSLSSHPIDTGSPLSSSSEGLQPTTTTTPAPPSSSSTTSSPQGSSESPVTPVPIPSSLTSPFSISGRFVSLSSGTYVEIKPLNDEDDKNAGSGAKHKMEAQQQHGDRSSRNDHDGDDDDGQLPSAVYIWTDIQKDASWILVYQAKLVEHDFSTCKTSIRLFFKVVDSPEGPSHVQDIALLEEDLNPSSINRDDDDGGESDSAKQRCQEKYDDDHWEDSHVLPPVLKGVYSGSGIISKFYTSCGQDAASWDDCPTATDDPTPIVQTLSPDSVSTTPSPNIANANSTANGAQMSAYGGKAQNADQGSGGTQTIVIALLVVVITLLIVVGALVFYRKRKNRRESNNRKFGVGAGNMTVDDLETANQRPDHGDQYVIDDNPEEGESMGNMSPDFDNTNTATPSVPALNDDRQQQQSGSVAEVSPSPHVGVPVMGTVLEFSPSSVGGADIGSHHHSRQEDYSDNEGEGVGDRFAAVSKSAAEKPSAPLPEDFPTVLSGFHGSQPQEHGPPPRPVRQEGHHSSSRTVGTTDVDVEFIDDEGEGDDDPRYEGRRSRAAEDDLPSTTHQSSTVGGATTIENIDERSAETKRDSTRPPPPGGW